MTNCSPGWVAKKLDKPSVPPAVVPPVPVNVIDCAGVALTTPVQTSGADPTRVVMIGTDRPIPVCLMDEKDVATTQKCDKTTGNTILIRSVFNDDTNVWETPTYFDLVLGATYTGTPADLEACSDSDIESDAIIGCDGGVSVTKWVVKKNGQPTGVVYFTNDSTNAIVTPVAWTAGVCPVAIVANTVTGGTLGVIAGSAINATGTGTLFDGAPDTVDTGAITGALQSVTISARGVKDGHKDGSTPDQINIDFPDGTTEPMFDGETKTFSVVKDTDTELRRDYRFRATGKAYATIHYTFI